MRVGRELSFYLFYSWRRRAFLPAFELRVQQTLTSGPSAELAIALIRPILEHPQGSSRLRRAFAGPV